MKRMVLHQPEVAHWHWLTWRGKNDSKMSLLTHLHSWPLSYSWWMIQWCVVPEDRHMLCSTLGKGFIQIEMNSAIAVIELTPRMLQTHLPGSAVSIPDISALKQSPAPLPGLWLILPLSFQVTEPENQMSFQLVSLTHISSQIHIPSYGFCSLALPSAFWVIP